MRFMIGRQAGVVAITGLVVAAAAGGAVAATRPSTSTATVLRLGSTLLVARKSGVFQAKLAATLTTSGKPLARHVMTLRERATGTAAWLAVGGTWTTNATGSVKATVAQVNPSEQYQFIFPASGGLGGSASLIAVLVQPVKTSLRISTAHTVLSAALKYQDLLTGVLLSGKVPLAGRPVTLRERGSGTTAWVAVGPVSTTNTKGMVTHVVTQVAKTEQYQFVFARDAGHRASVSALVTLTRP